jgi:plastocyanin
MKAEPRGISDSAKRARAALAPLACSLAVLALGAAPAAAGGPAPAGPTSAIHDRIYTPSAITVAAGQSIVWRNETLGPHTVTSTSELFNSGRIEGGTGYTLKYSTPGSFDYYCTVHPTMKGVVTVLSIPAERILVHVSSVQHRDAVRVQVARAGVPALLQTAPAHGGAFKTIARAELGSQGTVSFSVAGGGRGRRARVLVAAAYGQPRLISRAVALP